MIPGRLQDYKDAVGDVYGKDNSHLQLGLDVGLDEGCVANTHKWEWYLPKVAVNGLWLNFLSKLIAWNAFSCELFRAYKELKA